MARKKKKSIFIGMFIGFFRLLWFIIKGIYWVFRFLFIKLKKKKQEVVEGGDEDTEIIIEKKGKPKPDALKSKKVKELEREIDRKKDSFMEMRSKKVSLEKVLASLDKKRIGDIDYIPELQRRASAIESRTVPAMEKLGLANKAFIDARKEFESASRMDKGFKSAGERVGWYIKGDSAKRMRKGRAPDNYKGMIVYVYRGEIEAKKRFKKAQSEYEQRKERFDDIKAECKKLDGEYRLIKDQYAGRIKKDIEQIKEQMSDLKDEGDKLKEEIKKIQD